MRTIEKYDGPMIEKELRFVQWCKTRDIKFFGFDADDTLWETVPIFRKQMDLCDDFLATEAPILSRDAWAQRIRDINNQAFENMGVNPNRWNFVTHEAIGMLGVEEEIRKKAEDILMEIYNIKPKLLPKTADTLSFIRKCGFELGKITHSNISWDIKKNSWTGMDAYFNDDNTFRIEENGHKTKESWNSALNFFRVRPENCVIVGDSPRADILPAEELGVRERILVNNPNYSRWTIHDLPVSEQTIVVADIGEMIYLRN